MPKRSSEFNSSFSVQKEIMDLKSQLSEKESELIRIECGGLMSSGPESTTSNSSTSEAEEWQAKYERLAEAHKKLQRTNMNLEEKLLKIVDKFEGEKNLINRDLATQTQKVVEAKLTIQQMHKQNTQLKSDLNVALNILQMKPNSFVSHKMDSLPEDLQSRVKQYNIEKEEKRNFRNGGHKITVAVPNGAFESNDGEAVSAAILARVLEERENERKKEQKFCIDIGTQTHRWQFPDAMQLLKHSRARNLFRDDYSLLEELTILSAAEKEFSNARKQFLADKGYLDDSDCISEEEEDLEDLNSLEYPKTHVSNILLASLMQPPSGGPHVSNNQTWKKNKYKDNDINLKKEKARKNRVQEAPFPKNVSDFSSSMFQQTDECGASESESLKSFNLLGSNSKLSGFEVIQPNTGEDINHHEFEPEPHYESLNDLNEVDFYQSKDQNQIYSSQPSSISSLLSLTQKAFTPNTLQRSFSTSSYSAVQTEL